jgi:Domain of unknown function (DUF4136)
VIAARASHRYRPAQRVASAIAPENLVKIPSLARSLVSMTAALAFVALPGCKSTMPMEVNSSFGPGMKYDAVGSTFAWSPVATASMQQQAAARPYMHDLVLETVEQDMIRKGYRKAAGDTTDMWLTYDAAGREKLAEMSSEVLIEVVYGVNIIDPVTSKPMYRGTARIQLDRSAPVEKRRATIQEATRRILEKFPNSKTAAK